MNKMTEKLASANLAGLETVKTVVNASLDGVGRLTALNLQTARAVAERAAGNFAVLAEVRDLESLVAVQKPMILSAAEQSFAYSRRVYAICSESSSSVVQALDGPLGEARGSLFAVIEKGRQALSPAFNLALSRAKSMISTASQAYGSVSPLAQPALAGAPGGNAPLLPLIEKVS